MKELIAAALEQLRQNTPLVQCITNFVTVNDCANIILAAGASPSMAHALEEAAEAVESAQALVCNMGAIEDVPAMLSAGSRANSLGIPVLLDPVAVGGTQLRRRSAAELMSRLRFTAIRGNASEIRYLAGLECHGSGVDVSAADMLTGDGLPLAAERAKELSRRSGAAVCISGAIDLVAYGGKAVALYNGCPTMARVTGCGCMLTSLMGAFCGALPKDPFAAAVSAMAVMGIAGEKAEEKRLELGTGNASFRTYLIDAVFNMEAKDIREGVRYEFF